MNCVFVDLVSSVFYILAKLCVNVEQLNQVLKMLFCATLLIVNRS